MKFFNFKKLSWQYKYPLYNSISNLVYFFFKYNNLKFWNFKIKLFFWKTMLTYHNMYKLSNFGKLYQKILFYKFNFFITEFWKNNFFVKYLNKFKAIENFRWTVCFNLISCLIKNSFDLKLTNTLWLRWFLHFFFWWRWRWNLLRVWRYWFFRSSWPITGYMFIKCTKNNFFVTIMDNWGNTLLTRTGGNTGRTATWQRSNVFSADNAVYEASVLALEKGLTRVWIHIWSTIWWPQIRNAFSGFKVTKMWVHSVIYRPIVAFGGCWEKKWWRV